MSESVVTASAPARIDLAGGTLDLWPLHVLHPGSVTVNVAIDRRAHCRVRSIRNGFRVVLRDSNFERNAASAAELFADPRTALAGALLEALTVEEGLEIEIWSEVPFGSGLGGSSALTVAMAAALERWSGRRHASSDSIAFLRDVETRVLGKPAGVQDYYPPRAGGAHVITFREGRTDDERLDVDPAAWDSHLTLYDSGRSHSSGMNNWEVFKARLEGEPPVTRHLEEIRQAAQRMAGALRQLDFREMGAALSAEWAARRRLAPVVTTPSIERAVTAAVEAGAWGGKACGAGGGGCVVFLSPEQRTAAVRSALSSLEEGAVVPARVLNEGARLLEVEAPSPPSQF